MYISEKEASSILGLSIKKMQKDRLQRIGLPYYKFGRSVRYKIADIEDWASRQKVTHAYN